MTSVPKFELGFGLYPTTVSNRALYHIESLVVATTPHLLNTGTPEAFQQFLVEKGDPSAYIQYDARGSAVGYLALSELYESDCMEVRSIAVAPQYQRGGYGQKMMLVAESIALFAGRKKISLATSPDNKMAVRFYTALGYTITETVQNYYGDGTPRHLLEKELLGF